MYRFYLAAIDMIPGALILAPVYLILNKAHFHSTRNTILYYLFSCYLSVVYVLVGLPNITYIRPELNINLIPIIGITDDWKNSILNILLFVPLGLMLPIMWDRFRNQKDALLLGFCISLTIELLQMLTFRATDVNDLITNTLGTHVGFLCAKGLLHKYQIAKNCTMGEIGIVFSSVLLVMFFVYPFVSSAMWDIILQ